MDSGSRLQSSLGHNMLQQLFDDMREIKDTVDSIEIPARGRCKVYMAKYGYDPFKQSPNDNPDNELAFNAGDYIMVFDDIDEDGYFIGELMDGRRGFVPSNWLDRLTGEDLFEFQATTLYNKQSNRDDESDVNSYPPEFYDAIFSDTINHSNFQHILAPEDYHRMNGYVDLDDVDEVDNECLSDYERAEAERMRRAVPPPQRLMVERQLNKSILISWLHPIADMGTIVSYQVYVDGVLKSSVPRDNTTKALLDGVYSTMPHRISVRAIDCNGNHSNDAGCTIVIGQNIPFAPSCVKASHITSDSALISWLPCNSNFHHVVAVNSVEIKSVEPGVYKHLINGLSANTLYRVMVRAKPGKILSIDEDNPKRLESLSTYVDFKTMPKSLPDPPVNVQVETGPQKRTLLVTWLPLTLNDYGGSNGCAVTGYAVFAGHKKLADIDSPTGDHALLNVSDLESLHKKSVTVRTKSGENLSQDSMPCQIPDEYLKAAELSNSGHHGQHRSASAVRHQQRSLLVEAGNGSPRRGRYGHNADARSQHPHSRSNSRYPNMRARQLTRSLQNLESDLDSHRSSIPAIEVTREISSSDMINHTEHSYSEEEFENSMRHRALGRSPKASARVVGSGNRYRTRQSHSVDGSLRGSRITQPRQYQQVAGGRFRSTPISDQDVRYFQALFDYDPFTMSPNPNAMSEELAFKEGSIIRIFGDKGPDGFYRGELDGKIGFVPSNVVAEIPEPNPIYNLNQVKPRSRNQQLPSISNYQQQQQQQQQQRTSTTYNSMQLQQPMAQPADQELGGVRRMTALYDYDPQENSPNADTESEIPFRIGDVIYVYGKMDADGFYMGEVERTKQRGLVPSNFVCDDPLSTNQTQQQHQHQNQQFSQPNHAPEPFQQAHRPTNQLNQSVGAGLPAVQQHFGADPASNLNGSSLLGSQMPMQTNQQQMSKIGADMARMGSSMLPSAQAGQNINRPTSLSLGSSLIGNQLINDWTQTNNPRQQLIGAAMQQSGQQTLDGVINSGNFMNMAQGPQIQQQMQLNNQYSQQHQHQQQQQHQHQQSSAAGVLGNLLSSGRQMIGAATTPRTSNNLAQVGTPANLIDSGGNFSPATSTSLSNVTGRVNMVPNQAMQNSVVGHDQSHNSFVTSSQSQGQHLGLGRGQMSHVGEDQGGTILNTVKNIFKL